MIRTKHIDKLKQKLKPKYSKAKQYAEILYATQISLIILLFILARQRVDAHKEYHKQDFG